MESGIKKWIEHFGFSETQVTHWITTSGEANPLHWCLLNQKVSQPDYLNWASETYELPVVTEDFFQIQPDDRFWSTVSSLHFWNPGLFPLSEWEGTLMIACVEPPENFRIDRPHRFVLASAQHLHHHWTKLNPSQAATITITPAQAPSPSRTEKVATKESTDPVENSFIRAFSSFTGGEPPAIEAPAGLKLSVDALDDDSRSNGPDGLTQTIVPLSSKHGSTPDGLTADIDSVLAVRMDLPDGVVADSFEPSSGHEETIEAVSLERPVPELEAAPEHEPEPPQVDEPQDHDATSTAHVAPVASTTSPRHRMSETTAIGLIDLETITPKPISNCENLDELAIQSLAELAKTFESSLILQYVNGIPSPWRWAGIEIKGKSPMGYSLDLGTPSMFRIVHTTQLPYSGRIASSPVHDLFFSVFLGKSTPVHATIVPIMSGKSIVAMLMGFDSKPMPALESLDRVNSLASSFSKTWAQLHGAKAA